MSGMAQMFTEQVTLQQQVSAFYYIFATMGVFMGVVAIALVDAGFSSSKNLIDTLAQKLMAVFISAFSFMLVGYAIWNYQYYQALAVPEPFLQAVKDWWLAGGNLTRFAHQIDPASAPGADTAQIFSVFFLCFAGLTAALIHGGGIERMKPAATAAMSVFIGGVVVPVASYLAYGSAGPLSNIGVHDFVGAYCLYIPVGIWALMLAKKLGHRSSGAGQVGSPLLALGGGLLMLVAIPIFVVGCGFMTPGAGYYGPSLSLSGIGIIFINVFLAFCGGGIVGSVIAYKKRQPIYILSGAVSGYIACSAMFDLLFPWQALLYSAAGPLLMLVGERVVKALDIDEPKVAALTLAPACFSAVAAGWVGSGVAQGGYFGITEGAFALQHASISVTTQLLGVAVIASLSAVSAWVVLTCLDKTIGLRVCDEVERTGLDAHYWVGQTVATEHPASEEHQQQSSLLASGHYQKR